MLCFTVGDKMMAKVLSCVISGYNISLLTSRGSQGSRTLESKCLFWIERYLCTENQFLCEITVLAIAATIQDTNSSILGHFNNTFLAY